MSPAPAQLGTMTMRENWEMHMTKPRRPLVTCPQCRGVGKVPPADSSQSGMVTCPTCGGSGKVQG